MRHLRSALVLTVVVWAASLHQAAAAEPEIVHVYVALCDNASQGIIPVPAKIGDGDQPDANLYWGCSEGVRSWFKASKRWKKMPAEPSTRPEVLERAVFKHADRNLYLVAEAWRGREIKSCLQAFVNAAAGDGTESVPLKTATATSEKPTILAAGGSSKLVAYIGHNGLMAFTVDWPVKPAVENVNLRTPKPAIVLCCVSQKYFGDKLTASGADPLLTTTQLMYPGAFILHDALEVWMTGGNAANIKAGLKAAAARAYAKNQGISIKAANGVFW